MLKEQGNTWATTLKENSKNKRIRPKTSYATKSPSLWWPQGLLTSINWWSSQKEKNHTQTHKEA